MRCQDFNLSTIFGVASRTDPSGEKIRILNRSRTPLQPVLDRIEQGDDDIDIEQDLKLSPRELASARAWHARFGADASAPAPLPPGPKAFLLDECIPTTLLSHVNDYFGFSSHVVAEGWARRNPSELVRLIQRKQVDAGIAGFAMEQQFAGIITRDSDFKTLAEKKSHPAAKVHILLFHGPWQPEDLRESLDINRLEVQRALKQEPRVHHIRYNQPFLIA